MEGKKVSIDLSDDDDKFDGVRISVPKSLVIGVMMFLLSNFVGLKDAANVADGALNDVQKENRKLRDEIADADKKLTEIQGRLDVMVVQHQVLIEKVQTLSNQPGKSGDARRHR